MDIFNQFVSAFIGALITLLPTAGAQSSLSTDVATASSSTAAQTGALIHLRDTLVSFQSRFELASGHFARTEDSSEHATSSDPDNRNDDSDESEEHENRRTSASTSAQITESKRGISSGRNETSRHSENEEESEHDESDDDEDEDRGEHRSSTTASTSPTPAPTQQPATTPTYTTAQVAAHSTAASCYSIVNGSVYDLTRWISQHPGGSGAIKSMCGVDASAAFNGQHGGSPRPASELSGFKIGALAR